MKSEFVGGSTFKVLVVVGVLGANAFAQYCPSNGPPTGDDSRPPPREGANQCPGGPPPPNDDSGGGGSNAGGSKGGGAKGGGAKGGGSNGGASKGGGANEAVGDPVLVYGTDLISYDKIEDFALRTPLGPVSFQRSYVGNDAPWQGGQSYGLGAKLLSDMPTPFGSSPTNIESTRWTHNFFAFISINQGSPNDWTVRTPRGSQEEFGSCTAPCWASRPSDSPGQRSRLKRLSDNTFLFFQDDGKIYAFETQATSPAPGSKSYYFLTRAVNSDGTTLATVIYGPPADASENALNGCPAAWAAGSAPYISIIRPAAGPDISMAYVKLPRWSNSSYFECVVSSVKIGGTTALQYTYDTPSGGTISVGHLIGAATPTWSEVYAAFGTPFSITRNGAVIVSHALSGGSPSMSDRTGARTITQTLATPTFLYGGSYPCANTQQERTVTVTSSLVGNGTSTASGLVEKYRMMSGNGISVHRQIPLERQDSCTTSDSCSAGTELWWWRGVVTPGACAAWNPGVLFGTKDKRDSWTLSPTVQSGVAGAPFERTAVYRGVPPGAGGGSGSFPFPDSAGLAGTSALEKTTYTTAYVNTDEIQYDSLETRPSQITGNQKIHHRRDSQGRETAVFVEGNTRNLAGSPVTRIVAVFTVYDTLGRVTEQLGPCEVSATTAADCGTLSDFPRTTLAYYGPSLGLNSNQLYTVTEYRDGSATLSDHITTTFSDYTEFGEPQTVVDANNVTIKLTYLGHQVATRRVWLGSSPGGGDPIWTYNWVDPVTGGQSEKLQSIGFPEGNSEIYCYRALSTPDGACNGAWKGRLTRRLRSTTSSLSNWTEAVLYTYNGDGTLSTTKSYVNTGSGYEERRVRTLSADAHKRPTYSLVGASAGFASKSGFDAANNMVGVGRPLNNPPDWCRIPYGGGALSPACAQMGYDRANRIRQLDLFPTSTSSTPVERVCIDYDFRGNVTKMTAGLTSGTCNTDFNESSSGSEPFTKWETDDFGNIITIQGAGSVASGGANGVTRITYDALGNVTAQQSEFQRTASPSAMYIAHTYDRMGRRLTTSEVQGSTPIVVASYGYDVGGTNPPATGCLSLVRTKGRLAWVSDPAITRWYQYDQFGRVTREMRMPVGETCNLDLKLSYTPNGNLSTITSGHDRMVTYEHASHPDRVSGIKVRRYTSSGAVDVPIISQVTWEPYGDLRSYRMLFLNSTYADMNLEMGASTTTPSGASTTPPAGPDCPVGAIGETNDKSGRLRTVWVKNSAGNDLFRKTYRWSADEITRMSTCYKGDNRVILEDYTGTSNGYDNGYDGTGRLRGGVGFNNFFAGATSIGSAQYQYNARGNITKEWVTTWGHYYTNTYASSSNASKDQLVSSVSSLDSFIGRSYTYDADGRAASIYGPNDSSGTPAFQTLLSYSASGSSTPGAMTAIRFVTTKGFLVYQYLYDTQRRRQGKIYPVNARSDLFLYDLGHQMLDDRGISSLTGTLEYPLDEYVWLAGRPVAIYRSKVTKTGSGSTTAWARGFDDSPATCTRLDVASPCGLYFVVSDHLKKPVVTFNETGLISGVGEYNPYGVINRVPFWATTSHPYTKGVEGPMYWTLQQHALGSLPVKMRLQFPLLDTETVWPAGGIREGPSIWNDSLSAMFEVLGGYHQGGKWSQWWNASAVGNFRTLKLGWGTVAGNCWPVPVTPPQSCPQPSGSGWGYMGFTTNEYEYQRFETTTSYFPPLRFPGHYYDEETDLFENWHRNYSPAVGRYLAPEPLLLEVPKREAYAYAGGNPITRFDPDGLRFIWDSSDQNMNRAIERYRATRIGRENWKYWDKRPELMFLESGRVMTDVNGTILAWGQTRGWAGAGSWMQKCWVETNPAYQNLGPDGDPASTLGHEIQHMINRIRFGPFWMGQADSEREEYYIQRELGINGTNESFTFGVH